MSSPSSSACSAVGRSAWAMLRADAGGNEQRRCLYLDVRSVPCSRVVDGILTGAEDGGQPRVICAFLVERDRPGGAKYDLAAAGMHLPNVPRFLENVHAHQSSFNTVAPVTPRVV